jgi:hypothetical protein
LRLARLEAVKTGLIDRYGDESLERAVGAPQAREAVRQHPAGQEVSERLFHELRQR